MMYRSRIRALMIGALTLGGLSSFAQPPGQQPPPPEVAYVTVSPETLPVSYKFIGVADASKTVEVRARIRGFIESRDFEEGALVQPGDALFTIDASSYKADLDIAKARVDQADARLHLAEQDVRRLQSVKEPGAIAQSDLDKQVAERSNADASLRLSKAELAKAELELSYTRVESPLSGYIGKSLKEIGSYVDEGQNSLLATVRQVDPIFVSFQVSEREWLQWRGQVQRGELILTNGSDPYVEITLLDGSTVPQRGEIDFESAVVNVQTGTVEVRAVFSNAENTLKPGQFLDVNLGGWERPNTLSVPQRAVGQSPQGAYVYVAGTESIAEMRMVKPGPWSGSNWIIESGLEPGDRVIVEGLIKVQPGIHVVPVEWTGNAPPPAVPPAPAEAAAPETN
jgi:membrane fusion protein (multidrug efflux system)